MEMMMKRHPSTALVLMAAVFLALTALGARQMWTYEHGTLVVLMLAQGVLYAGAAWWVLRQRAQPEGWRALTIVLGTAILARAILLPMPPVSTDIYRYVWDGRIQSAGINPYLHRPADPAVAAYRDAAIYPSINRAETALTIYPPMAQIVFLAVSRLGDSVMSMKAAMVAFEALAMVAILRLLAARGLPGSRILLYAWHPLPLHEFAGSGHVDAIAIGLMMAAMLAADVKRPFLSGMLLAAGAAAKYVPVMVGPALYRRWDWRMPIGFILALALLYLPYLGAGWNILGFLPGYVEEEGIAGGGIFWIALLQRFTAIPEGTAVVYLGIAALGLASLGIFAVYRRSPGISLPLAAGLLTAFILVFTPHYAWYFTWLVPLLCLRVSAAAMWLTLTAPMLYGLSWLPDEFIVKALLYGGFLFILVLETVRPHHRPAAQGVPQ